MKTGSIHILLIFALFSSCRKAPEEIIVDIPDNKFLAALIEYGIDTDGDGAISNTEAGSVIVLELEGTFYNTKGIETFVNLEKFICRAFFLDLSKNTLLKYLDCSDGMLEQLDVSHNLMLEYLD